MKWPWVSRRAYDAVLEERDRLLQGQRDLREDLTTLRDHLMRVDRREHGMTETPRESKPDPGPIPKEIDEQIMGYLSSSTRNQMRRECRRLAREGKTWEQIAVLVFDPVQPEAILEEGE